jgi:hypothetical protein
VLNNDINSGERTMSTSIKTATIRIAAAIVTVAAMQMAAPSDAAAQTTPERFQLMLNSGKLVPTGAQRDAFETSNLTAAQFFYSVHPAVAVTAALGWARSRDAVAVSNNRVDVFTYDAGAEVRAPALAIGNGITFRPMAGLGAGARSYNYRHRDVDATHNVAAYGSAAGELGYRRVRIRIEARDYVTSFQPLIGEGSSDTRNDVAVIVGVRVLAR